MNKTWVSSCVFSEGLCRLGMAYAVKHQVGYKVSMGPELDNYCNSFVLVSSGNAALCTYLIKKCSALYSSPSCQELVRKCYDCCNAASCYLHDAVTLFYQC